MERSLAFPDPAQSAFAGWLEVAELGLYDAANGRYGLTVTPTWVMLNRMKFVHGGLLLALCDIVAEELICRQVGEGKAVTQHLDATFHHPVRVNIPVSVVAQAGECDSESIAVKTVVQNGNLVYATVNSQWYIRRKARG